jgi:hypothetical protein
LRVPRHRLGPRRLSLLPEVVLLLFLSLLLILMLRGREILIERRQSGSGRPDYRRQTPRHRRRRRRHRRRHRHHVLGHGVSAPELLAQLLVLVLTPAARELASKTQAARMSLEVELLLGETAPASVNADGAWIMRETRSDSHGPMLARARGCFEAATLAVVGRKLGQNGSGEARPQVPRGAIPEPSSQSPPQHYTDDIEHHGKDRTDKGVEPETAPALVRPLIRVHDFLVSPRSRCRSNCVMM